MPELSFWQAMSQCTYRCVVLPDAIDVKRIKRIGVSQCTYRCVVLPDMRDPEGDIPFDQVSMHLQVRGAP